MASTINPNIPVNGTQIDATEIKNNFSAAHNDIEALQQDLSGLQPTLVSGTNIKTINGNSILGSGNLDVSGGGSGVNIVVNSADIEVGKTGVVAIKKGVKPTVSGLLDQVQLFVDYLPFGDSLVPIMTSSTTPSGTVFSSSDYNADTAAWHAFANAAWLGNGNSGNIGYTFATAQKVIKYSLYPWDVDNFPNRCFKDWTFEGSNDYGVTWDVLDTVTGQSWVSNTAVTRTFANTTAYLSYRFNVTATVGTVGFIGCRNITFYAGGNVGHLFGMTGDGTVGLIF